MQAIKSALFYMTWTYICFLFFSVKRQRVTNEGVLRTCSSSRSQEVSMVTWTLQWTSVHGLCCFWLSLACCFLLADCCSKYLLKCWLRGLVINKRSEGRLPRHSRVTYHHYVTIREKPHISFKNVLSKSPTTHSTEGDPGEMTHNYYATKRVIKRTQRP